MVQEAQNIADPWKCRLSARRKKIRQGSLCRPTCPDHDRWKNNRTISFSYSHNSVLTLCIAILPLCLSCVCGASASDAPDDASARAEAHGNSLSRHHKYKEALPYYRLAIQLNPQRVRSYVHMGDNLVELDQPKEAIAVLTKGLELGKQQDELWYSRSKAYVAVGDLKQ